MNDGKSMGSPQRLERSQGWMKSEKAIEIDRCVRIAGLGRSNGNTFAGLVISALTMGN